LFATKVRDRALQKEKVEEREAMILDLDLAKNCMFIVEAGLIFIHKEAMVDLEKARQPKALYQRQNRLQVSGHRYLIEETTDCVKLQREKRE
jgi:hypothetical protein